MAREIRIVKTGKETGIVAYGYAGTRKVYKIVALDDGYKVEHKDSDTSFRNTIKKYPNKGWHFNTCFLCDHYFHAEFHVLNDKC